MSNLDCKTRNLKRWDFNKILAENSSEGKYEVRKFFFDDSAIYFGLQAKVTARNWKNHYSGDPKSTMYQNQNRGQC